jgi:hypothetical protein
VLTCLALLLLPQVGSKSSGTWYRGSIKAVAQGYQGQRDFNPWESITVEWDYDDGRWGRSTCCSQWRLLLCAAVHHDLR